MQQVKPVKSDGGGSGGPTERGRMGGRRPAPSVRLGHASTTPRVPSRTQHHACRPWGGEARAAQVKGR